MGDVTKEETTNAIAEELIKLFCHRKDGAVGSLKGNEKHWRPLAAKHVINAPAIKLHLAGTQTLGAYQIHPDDDTLGWVCFDIDREADESKKELWLKVRRCAWGLRELSVPHSLEYTGCGFHLWVFPKHPMPAAAALPLAELWASRFRTDEGELIRVEIFPKQSGLDHTQKKRGNLVQLPLGHHLRTKERSRFFRLVKAGSAPNEDEYAAVEPGKETLEFLRGVSRAAVLARVVEDVKKETEERKEVGVPQGGDVPRSALRWVVRVCGGLCEGEPYRKQRQGRNEAIYSLARQMHRWGFRSNQILACLLEVNASNSPPLADDIVKGVVERATTHAGV